MRMRLRYLMIVPVSAGVFAHAAVSEDRPAGLALQPVQAPAGVVLAPPVSVNPSETGFAATTSLTALRDYNARLLASKAEQLTSPGLMTMPRPPQVSLPIDVWTRVQVDSASAGAADPSTNVVAGVVYKVGRSSSLGVSTPLTNFAAPSSSSAPTETEPLTAFANLQVLSGLTVRAEGKRHAGSTDAMTESGHVQAETHNEIYVAPRISQTFTLPKGQRLQPFVELKNAFEPEGGADVTSSAGAGFVFDAPGAYSFSLSTSVDQIGTDEESPAAKGRMELKIPIP
jgi:hypothetical protein